MKRVSISLKMYQVLKGRFGAPESRKGGNLGGPERWPEISKQLLGERSKEEGDGKGEPRARGRVIVGGVGS